MSLVSILQPSHNQIVKASFVSSVFSVRRSGTDTVLRFWDWGGRGFQPTGHGEQGHEGRKHWVLASPFLLFCLLISLRAQFHASKGLSGNVA